MTADKEEKPMFDPNVVLEQATLQTFAPRKGRKDSEGNETEPPTFVLTFRVPVDRIERYLGVLTRAWKNERGITLGLAFVEQLELLARKEAADKNGGGPATGGLTPIEGGKGKKKSREKEGAKA